MSLEDGFLIHQWLTLVTEMIMTTLRTCIYTLSVLKMSVVTKSWFPFRKHSVIDLGLQNSIKISSKYYLSFHFLFTILMWHIISYISVILFSWVINLNIISPK